MGEIHHARLQLEHVEPAGVSQIERNGTAAECGDLLEEATARESTGLVIREPDAADEIVQIGDVALVFREAIENRLGIEMDEHPADVEDDGPNQRLKPSR